tara:strand:- start:342 stop:824 length:483 start_codon:yes stop_codon:yes gene_type:complete
MAVIKPTLSIVSNASDFATTADQGPLTMALNLSVTDDITIVGVKSEALSFANTNVVALFTDDAVTGDEGAITTVAEDVAGTHGAFLYFKNTSPGDHDIYFAHETSGTGTGSDLSTAGDADRFGTLKQGEFMFVPWDYAGQFSIQPEDSAATAEYFIFSRT